MLVQVTVAPTGTVTVAGEKAKSVSVTCIVTGCGFVFPSAGAGVASGGVVVPPAGVGGGVVGVAGAA